MYATAENKDLHTKAHQAASDAQEGTRRIKDEVKEAVSNVKTDLEDIARQAGRQARDFVSSAEKNVVNATDSVTAKIYDNPVQSSLIALGVGVFLGLLMFRGK